MLERNSTIYWINMQNVRNLVPIGSLLLGIAVAILLHLYLPVKTVIEYPWTLLGILMIVVGIVQFASAAMLFSRQKTDIRPAGTPTSLITSGPYRYTRNPIYGANMIVLLGVSFLLGSLSPFITIPLYFLIVNTFVVPLEEHMLRSVFGDAYLEYKKRVRRWI